jgi:hypothetical protein
MKFTSLVKFNQLLLSNATVVITDDPICTNDSKFISIYTSNGHKVVFYGVVYDNTEDL